MKPFIKGISIFAIAFTFVSAQSGSFNGLVFYHLQHDLEDGGKSQFEFSRVYLTYTNKLSENVKYKFQTDVGRHKNSVKLEGAGSDSLSADLSNSRWLSVYLKNAKLDWTTSVGVVSIGLQGMNIFSVQEKTWGHRYLQKSPMDLHKFTSSADLGIGFARSISKDLSTSLLITNGIGYKSAENDTYKKFSLQTVWGQKNLSKKTGYNA
ncbi:MAG: hypothetical protein KAU50_02205, partial [Candidatus Marinimicrobia bacterium]|nr:hypothetical protein [Candidatus Neomarinimicrobiota bacterium]